MREIIFGEYRSFGDLGLILTDGRKTGAPEIKQKLVDIEGADGFLDYTDYFGQTFYKNRTLEFPFVHVADKLKDLEEYYSEVYRKLHGRRMKISYSWDDKLYYVGRINVGDWENEKRLGSVVITCDCEPYRYKKDVTVVRAAIDGTKTIVCNNLQKKTVPTIETTAEMMITFNGKSKTVNAGTILVPEFAFAEGENVMIFSGKGEVTIRYQERIL